MENQLLQEDVLIHLPVDYADKTKENLPINQSLNYTRKEDLAIHQLLIGHHKLKEFVYDMDGRYQHQNILDSEDFEHLKYPLKMLVKIARNFYCREGEHNLSEISEQLSTKDYLNFLAAMMIMRNDQAD